MDSEDTEDDTPPIPGVVMAPTPARRLRDTAEPVAMHAVWSKPVGAAMATVGLDFLGSYVVGRAISLGEPTGSVVAATFAWFEPGLIAGAYERSRGKTQRADLIEIRERATAASLRAVLGDDDPTWVADRLVDAVEQADGLGRPLFSGLRGRGRPGDPVHRLWWATDLLREHRGDSHVVVVAERRLDAVAMNILTELWLGYPLYAYSATRGWSRGGLEAAADALADKGWLTNGTLTVTGNTVRTEIEAATDAMEQTIVDALGSDLDRVCRSLDEWGRRCIEIGAFTADSLKRAAG